MQSYYQTPTYISPLPATGYPGETFTHSWKPEFTPILLLAEIPEQAGEIDK